MTLSPGSRLGPYEVVARIGAGGFGEVFRAIDVRLDRTVAIKVLAEEHMRDPEMRGRFEAEARAIAALSHPYICHLHDVGHGDGLDYLVMEYVEGETLATILASLRSRGAVLETRDVLRYALEITAAIGEAHRHGIVHRDLKPSNIIVTKAGVKLLDFGMAKLRDVPGSRMAGAATVAAAQQPLTKDGAILGTWQYMAPEQLEGKHTDTRCDIFALGAVLFEMVTSRKAFEGESHAGVIAAILDREPPAVSSIRSDTPIALERVIRGCLVKDRDERWQNVHDVGRVLHEIANDLAQASGNNSLHAPRRRISAVAVMTLFAIGVLAAVAALAARKTLRPATVPDARATHLAIPIAVDAPYFFGPSSSVAISPDGRHIVYAAGRQGSFLYHRTLDAPAVDRFEGSGGGQSPFFSPDGEWVGFFANRRLKKVRVTGGAVSVICEAVSARGATWGRNGTIVFAATGASGLFRVSADGGTPQPLTTRRPDEGSHRNPQFLPDGKAVLFATSVAESTSWDEARIEVVNVESGVRQTVLDGAGFARYVSSGHLVFARAGHLFATAFDPRMQRRIGQPVRVASGIASTLSADVELAVSESGVAAYVSSEALPTRDGSRHLVWVDRDGNETPVRDETAPYLWPRVSPDGRRVAAVLQGPTNSLWVDDVERSTFTRIAIKAEVMAPAWLTDARLLYTSSNEYGGEGLYAVPSDGSRGEEQLAAPDADPIALDDVSRDGRFALTTRTSPTTRSDIWIFPLGFDRAPFGFLQTAAEEYGARLSPDGRWVAYVSNESGLGQYHVYLRAFEGQQQRQQVSTDYANAVVWGPSGRELFYREPRHNRIMVVDIRTSPRLVVGRPRPLFELSGRYRDEFDIAPDGKRFVMVKVNQPQPPTHINIVVNWFEELNRRVPNGNP